MTNGETIYSTSAVDLDIHRSGFDRSYDHKLTFSASDLIPFFWDEVVPGDTFKVDTSFVIRTPALMRPVMDNCYLDMYFFFIPHRLAWEHWKAFCGENLDSAWVSSNTYTIPKISFSQLKSKGYIDFDQLWDYFGNPTDIPDNVVSDSLVSELLFRDYDLCWNEYFRDENLQNPCYVNISDTSTIPATDVSDSSYNGTFKVKRACKYHDRFTSALPAPQKGPSVLLPFDGEAPVLPSATQYTSTEGLTWKKLSGSNTGTFGISTATNGLGVYDTVLTTGTVSVGGPKVYPSNLSVSDWDAVAPSINSLRFAIQLQRFYERSARGGTRYRELIYSFFGVKSPDATQQVPQYLGGKRTPISITQVVQTSSTDATSPQGHVSGFSKTVDVGASFTQSFDEHGYILGLCCVRADQSYQQGINRSFTRTEFIDFYLPTFAHIGEQPVYLKELYAKDFQNYDSVFGYQEAWDDYRSRPNQISGHLRSDYPQSLDSWHFGQYYESRPYLSGEWIQDNFKETLDRCLSVPSTTEPQFVADFYNKVIAYRPMPVNSYPGLMDHF